MARKHLVAFLCSVQEFATVKPWLVQKQICVLPMRTCHVACASGIGYIGFGAMRLQLLRRPGLRYQGALMISQLLTLMLQRHERARLLCLGSLGCYVCLHAGPGMFQHYHAGRARLQRPEGETPSTA